MTTSPRSRRVIEESVTQPQPQDARGGSHQHGHTGQRGRPHQGGYDPPSRQAEDDPDAPGCSSRSMITGTRDTQSRLRRPSRLLLSHEKRHRTARTVEVDAALGPTGWKVRADDLTTLG